MPTAFVTGGTGFIGSHLVESLLRRGYSEVRCLVRGEPKWLADQSVTFIAGDLNDHEALRVGLEGVDYVYHSAAVIRSKDVSTFERINTDATRDLLERVEQVNPSVKKVVVVSSLATVGMGCRGIADEDTPLRPVSAYGRSKVLMEERLEAFRDKLPLVVVRPPVVYGPRDPQVHLFLKLIQHRICPMIGDGRQAEVSLVHVADLVEGMIAAAEAEQTTGETYFLGSRDCHTWYDLKHAAEKAFRHKALALPVRGSWVGPVGTLVETVCRWLGQPPPMTRTKMLEMRDMCKGCAIDKAARHFGYAPSVTLEDGMAETVAWYQQHGWL